MSLANKYNPCTGTACFVVPMLWCEYVHPENLPWEIVKLRFHKATYTMPQVNGLYF